MLICDAPNLTPIMAAPNLRDAQGLHSKKPKHSESVAFFRKTLCKTEMA